MEHNLNDSDAHSSPSLNKSDTEKSIVGKLKTHVSEIISNTPLSKWFRKNDEGKPVRIRDDQDDEIYQMQPPSKRARLPPESANNHTNHFHTPSTPLSNSVHSVVVPSTSHFPEPVAGPSGIKSRKLLNSTISKTSTIRTTSYAGNEVSNCQKDSDSEESTSGYSSVARISSKEQVFESRDNSKQTSPLENSPTNSRSLFHNNNSARSLFTDNSLNPNMNSSLSSRRPSFNTSTFGSPNFVDKTLSTKRIINSPFYSGRTIYGGASAYGRNLGRSARDLRAAMKTSIRIKPTNKVEERNVPLGKTAKRILDTLEQYSSPVNDAKKVPMVSKKMRTDGGLLTQYTGANPYSRARESKVASNSELQVPTVSDLLKMKQSKERLQDSTETVRQIATTSKSALNVETYKIPASETDKPRNTGGKMKTKMNCVRQKAPQQLEELTEPVLLTPVSLPITTLPKFDLNIPPPQPQATIFKSKTPEKPLFNFVAPKPPSTTLIPQQKTNTETESISKVNKPVEKQNDSTMDEYTFSKPLVIAENLKYIIGINNYKFSEPLLKKAKSDQDNSNASPAVNFKMPEIKAFPSPIPKHNGNNTAVKTPELMTTGSVMDVLGKNNKSSDLMDKFKPAAGTWECTSCLVRNQQDKTKCVACEAARAVPATTQEGFGAQFKISSDKWECTSCLVRNNKEDKVCVACTTPAPLTSTTPAPLTSLFADKFKSPNTWECGVCMIKNKNELVKCAACESPKTGSSEKQPSSSGFGSMFKPAAATWECGACMIRNKNELNKCAACETPKPGTNFTVAAVTVPATSQSSSGFSASFKLNKDIEWECNVCMVRNPSTNSKCQCCETTKPGAKDTLNLKEEKKSIASFNFGIDKATVSSFNFGIPTGVKEVIAVSTVPAASVFGDAVAKAATTPAANFSFGVPTAQKETVPEKKETKPEESKKKEQEAPKLGITPPIQPEVKVSEAKPSFTFKPVTANGDLSKPSEAPKSIFGSTTNTTQAAGLFNFGAKPTVTTTASSTTTLSTTSTTSTFIVASQSAVSSNSQTDPKSMFKFGGSSATSNQPSVPVGGLFGSPKTPSNGFGNAPSVTPINNVSNTSNPVFGTTPNANTSSTETPKPFAFGNTSSESNKPMFSFGQAAASPAKPTGFGFGQPATPAAPTGGFNFAAKSPASTLFGAAATTSPNLFGTVPVAASTSTEPVKNGGAFNFGGATNNNNQKAGFTFGGSATGITSGGAQPASGSSGGFNFGPTAATAAPASGGFNFSAGAPSFNFTEGAGITSFSATPSDGPPRRIKKAIRRTNQR